MNVSCMENIILVQVEDNLQQWGQLQGFCLPYSLYPLFLWKSKFCPIDSSQYFFLPTWFIACKFPLIMNIPLIRSLHIKQWFKTLLTCGNLLLSCIFFCIKYRQACPNGHLSFPVTARSSRRFLCNKLT